MVSISACHAEDPGSIPGGGVFAMLRRLLHRSARGQIPLHKRDRSLCCLLRVPCSRCASVCKQIVWLPSFDQHDKVACRGESGWCSDMTSTHGAWRHAEVQFLLPGVYLWTSQLDTYPHRHEHVYMGYIAAVVCHCITMEHSGAWFRSTDLWVMSPTR